jgi:hypothetical protein
MAKKEHKKYFLVVLGHLFLNCCFSYTQIWLASFFSLDIGPYTPSNWGCVCTFLGLFGGTQRAPKWPKTAFKTFFLVVLGPFFL